jgi:glycosyltransferase involved in cell wall biosynthesis
VPPRPDISVVICSFERPGHLRRCLLSLAAQRGVDGRFEVIVVDDGSRDETPEVVSSFQRQVNFRVEFVTHPHDGFQQARCRNKGILASNAPYLLFTDADCLLPADHLHQHLAARRPGVARAGDCFRINEAASAQIDDVAVESGRFEAPLASAVRRWRGRLHRKAIFYQLTGNRLRPKLIGWNMAIWRQDLVRTNGFDQWFRAWSCEDDDLAARLRASGVRIRTVLGYTHGYHLWHPPHSTTPTRWRDGVNVPYLRRPVRLTHCLNGLKPRAFESLSIRAIAGDQHARLARQVAAKFHSEPGRLELELLFWPGPAGFSRLAEHRILVTNDAHTVPPAVKRQAAATMTLGHRPSADSVLAALQRLLAGQSDDAAASHIERTAA